MIDGRSERGLQSFRKYINQMAEDFNDLDDPKKHPNQLRKIINLYKSVYNQTFENEDNYLFNQEIVDEYVNFLMRHDKIYEAIEARNRFIQYLKEQKVVDHQSRRAHLEIVCLYILAAEKFKLKSALEEFFKNTPNAYNQDEYILAENLKNALVGEASSSFHDEDWIKVQDTLKKPIFGFINNEIVKKLKLMCMAEIEKQEIERNKLAAV